MGLYTFLAPCQTPEKYATDCINHVKPYDEWLLAGGLPTHLKKYESVGIIIPNWMEK